MAQWLLENELRVFGVIFVAYAAGFCLIYSTDRAVRIGGVLICLASFMAGYFLLGAGFALVACSLLLLLFFPPWVVRKSNAIPESGPDTEPGLAPARDERIVELCSAADDISAHELRGVLQEAGIPSRVVGGYLENAAGGLPLGEPLSPRIWVREQDATRAREIVDAWMRRSTEESE